MSLKDQPGSGGVRVFTTPVEDETERIVVREPHCDCMMISAGPLLCCRNGRVSKLKGGYSPGKSGPETSGMGTTVRVLEETSGDMASSGMISREWSEVVDK